MSPKKSQSCGSTKGFKYVGEQKLPRMTSDESIEWDTSEL